ncbi:hypothetical protein LEN26_017194 [Aphanomyces euteiches]|nr:hypothetical protein LEN26_017194 [Aphanomyces euteiches]KAH9125397.1 hypothetical protein AeMF1_003974 [Aphanomyces euteiches]KAH9182853.1 hypothetical protein AeNC1_015171 [Aphanomyces euteiches]
MVSASTTIAAALLATTAYVDAHGTLFRPSLKFTGPNYAALKPQPGDIFTNYPDANLNAAAFGRAFKASNYKSFKEFILKNQDLSKGRFSNPKTPECGFTDPNGPVVPLPDQLEWYGGQMNHPGPCEVWCDDEIVVPFTSLSKGYYSIRQRQMCRQEPFDFLLDVDTSRMASLHGLCSHRQWKSSNPIYSCTNPSSFSTNASPLTVNSTPDVPNATFLSPYSSYFPSCSNFTPPATFAPRPTPAPRNQTTLLPTPKPKQNNSTTMPPCGDGKLSVYKQCGGDHYSGPTECKDGLVCHKWSDCYWQCIPIKA